MAGWLIAVLIVAAVLILILLLLQIRLKILFSCSLEGNMRLLIQAGPFKMRILPARRRTKRPAEKEEKAEKEKKPRPKRRASDLISLMTDLVPRAARAAGRLVLKIRVDRLTLHLIWGGEDAAAVAVGYGGATAAMGVFWGCIDHNFNVVRHDLSVDADFSRAAPAAEANVKVSLSLAQILGFGICLGVSSLPGLLRFLRSGDSGEKIQNGKAEEAT